MEHTDRMRLNFAYHTARILLECVDAGEVKADEQESLEILAANLAMNLAILNGCQTEFIEQFPNYFKEV